MTQPSLPQVGDVVAGKYRLTGVLGRGGMGIVFDAHHELLDRRVALKVLAPEVVANVEAVTRFMNEARAAARITSDRVVHVMDVGKLEGSELPYMVMERLEGIDLAQLVERQGGLQISDVVDLLVEAIEGVAHAHLEGIIHRDLKPSNLFLAQRSDRTTVVKVLDFGISKLSGPGGASSGSVTATSAILGSPLYMSPEQLRSSKSIDLRADIWSLGVIGYELLTQVVPFEGDNLVELFAAIQERTPRPITEIRHDVPPGLDEVVRRCLRRVPDERYSSVYSLGMALVPFGSPRARQSMDRLEAHISSKGRSVQELSSTMPGSVRPSLAPPRAAGSITPPTMRSDKPVSGSVSGGDSSRPSQPSNSQHAALSGPRGQAAISRNSGPLMQGAGTAAPWSSTGRRSLASLPGARLGSIAVVGVLFVGGLTGALYLKNRSRTNGDLGASSLDGAVMAAGARDASPATQAMQATSTSDAGGPVAATAPPDAAAGSSSIIRPDPPPQPGSAFFSHHQHPPTSSSVSNVAPPPPPPPPTQPTPPTPTGTTSPLHMEPIQ